MTYHDLLESGGLHTGSGNRPGRARIVSRETGNPNHHLWNNRGTWWCHFTVHRPDYTAERIRVSLQTADLELARARRDQLFDSATA